MKQHIPFILFSILFSIVAVTFAQSNSSESLLSDKTDSSQTFSLKRGELKAVEDWSVVDQKTLDQLQERWEKLENHGTSPKGPKLMISDDMNPEDLKIKNLPSLPKINSRGSGGIQFFKNTEPSASAPGFISRVNEPSAVGVGSYAFYTGNWFAASSTNSGDNFTFLNPFTGPFPPVNPGFCCDQTSEHHQATNTIFYLQQYLEDGTSGTQRINVDQGANGSFECYYDITPQDLGFATNNWADFPDMVASNNFLYHSSNVFTSAGAFSGSFVVRFPMSEISQCAGTVNIQFYTDTSMGSLRFTRGATTTMYFVSHISLSNIRIWSWTDASSTISISDRSVTSWNNDTRVCPGPDNLDWCGFIDARFSSAFVANGVVGLMWTPAQGGAFPFPYTRIARFNQAGLSLINEVDIWSNNIAFVYPSVAVNTNGDIGGTIMFGGGTSLYPGCAVWLSDDTNGDILAPLEAVSTISGTTGPSTNRSGDYTISRAFAPADNSFVGACFAYENSTFATSRYTHFGRTSDLIFKNGFD